MKYLIVDGKSELSKHFLIRTFHTSVVLLEYIPECQIFESEILKKDRFIRSYFIFVTYFPREVDGRVISEIYI